MPEMQKGYEPDDPDQHMLDALNRCKDLVDRLTPSEVKILVDSGKYPRWMEREIAYCALTRWQNEG